MWSTDLFLGVRARNRAYPTGRSQCSQTVPGFPPLPVHPPTTALTSSSYAPPSDPKADPVPMDEKPFVAEREPERSESLPPLPSTTWVKKLEEKISFPAPAAAQNKSSVKSQRFVAGAGQQSKVTPAEVIRHTIERGAWWVVCLLYTSRCV